MASTLASALGRDPQASIQPYPRQPMARIPEHNMQRPPQQLERLSPGVYRGPNGSLVSGGGQPLGSQPQQPNPYQRDQFPGRQFSPDMMQQQPMPNNFQGQGFPPPANWNAMQPGLQQGMQQAMGQLNGQNPPQNVNIGRGLDMPIRMPTNGNPSWKGY